MGALYVITRKFRTKLQFARFYQITGPILDESQVRSIIEEIKQVITASSTRKSERAERAKAEDFDAEEGELLNEENELEDELFDQVCNYNAYLYTYICICTHISMYIYVGWTTNGSNRHIVFFNKKAY